MGDAAHAIVPFYGQGMNASFEDVTVFMDTLEKTKYNFEEAIEKYAEIRKIDGDAIGDLAEENFYEMSDYVARPDFIRKRNLERKLEATFPDYRSKYSMVTFTETTPYHYAMAKGRAQDKLLLELCKEAEPSMNLEEIYHKIQAEIYPEKQTQIH